MIINSIAGRGGHNKYAPGASALLDEVTEDRLVWASTFAYLKKANKSVYDVTCNDVNDVNGDLKYGVSRANELNVDVFASIHFNKAFDSFNGALGTEVWCNMGSPAAVEVATRVVNKLAALGFKCRGIKDGYNISHLYEVRNTRMIGIIVEVCFVEATEDVALYKKLGHDVVGHAIAEGIIDASIPLTINNSEGFDMKKCVLYTNPVDKRAAEYLADYLQCITVDIANYSSVKAEQFFGVGGGGFPLGTTIVKGTDRFDTVKEVLKYIGRV